MILLIAIAVFMAAAIYDFVVATYVRAVTDHDSTHAARLSVLTYAVGLVGLIGILKYSLFMVIPEALGLYVGTFAAVEYQVFKVRGEDE